HPGTASGPARRLGDQFNVRVHIVPVGDASPAARLDRVARMAAAIFADSVSDNQMIGVAWGTTLATVVKNIDRRPLKGTTIVQLNGGANALDPGTAHVGGILEGLSAAFDAALVHFPVPAFFDYVETKEAMWRERSVQHVLEMQHRLDLAIFGVGSFTSSIPSHVYSAGYLDEDDMSQLANDGAVGDVCTVMLREDGTWEDIELNRRATGLAPRDLRRIPKRICVASDPLRAPAVLGALRLGVVTDLVIDDQTATAVIARM
ncbi:MAG: transcriptional regulator, partial [Actinobacteria bacterium]|nr:transcriptional regulator [Actinomycetota bacterium]